MTASVTSFLDALLAAHDPDRICRSVEIRSTAGGHADMRLIFADRNWLRGPHGARLLDAIRSEPDVARAERSGSAIAVRLTDALVAALGERLAAGEPVGLSAGGRLAGRRFMVGFIGPNTCKALHVGHLRNMVLGDALAAVLAAASGGVVRESLVGDIGRSVCEAMAGLELFHAHEDPAALGMKPDHFVGVGYRDYLTRPGAPAPAGDDPTHEDAPLTGDAADQLLVRWRDGEPTARALWTRVRDLTLAGHGETLARLGIAIDRFDYESDGMVTGMALIAQGLAQGILVRGRGGRVVYPTGRAEYPNLVLSRDDGFPTEHGRLLGNYDAILGALGDDGVYVELAGDDWRPSGVPMHELLAKLRPGPRNARHVRLFHALVTFGGSKLSSSQGAPMLVDEMLDRLAADARIIALAGDAVDPASVVDLAIRGYFLYRPAARVMTFDWAELVDETRNPGLTLAAAWRRASLGARDASGAIDPADPDDRLAALRTQNVPRVIDHAAEQLDLGAPMGLLRALSEDYLATRPSAPRDRITRTVLRAVLPSVGFQAGHA